MIEIKLCTCSAVDAVFTGSSPLCYQLVGDQLREIQIWKDGLSIMLVNAMSPASCNDEIFFGDTGRQQKTEKEEGMSRETIVEFLY